MSCMYIMPAFVHDFQYMILLLIVTDTKMSKMDSRKKDHVKTIFFALTSIIKNRMLENKDTFCSFIDMQNVFDWFNRDMLFYRLLDYNIDGNIYNCIKALYRHPLACIKINGYISE